MALVDVALGTLGRPDQFCKSIQSLNNQTIANKLSLFIMDGNEGNNEVSEFMNSCKWKFESYRIWKEEEHVPRKHRGKWAIMYNFLMKRGGSPYATFWSDDVFPEPDCFEVGINGFSHPNKRVRNKIGAVAFAWRDGKNGRYTIYGTEMHKQTMVNFGLILRRALDRVGYLDESYSFYNADQDLSLKLWYVGLRIMRVPGARVTHWSGTKCKNRNRSGETYKLDCRRFTSKWSYARVRDRRVAI